MLTRNFIAAAVSLCLAAGVCSAREVLTLKSGFTIEVDSHSMQNGIVTAISGAGTMEFPAAQIVAIEVLPDAPVAKPAAPKPVDNSPETLLANAAETQGLSTDLVRAVAKAESGLRVNAVSRKGAVGLMQLMPKTAAELNVAANNPAENAKGGAAYLRQLLLAFHGNAALALAAYNAGPAAVAKYGGVPPYPETRRYVLKILTQLAKTQAR